MLAEAYPPPDSIGSSPGHPLRIIRDWVRDFPMGPRSAVVTRQLDKRRTLTDAVLRHAAAGGRSAVLGPALCAVLDPNLESWEADAGSGRSVTVRATLAPVEVLEQLGDLWARLRGMLVTLDRPLWSSSREAVRKLSHPMVPFGSIVPDAERHAARALAARIVGDLLPLVAERPGLRRELGTFARDLGVAEDTARDRTYELLFPERPLSEPDFSRWAAAQRKAVSRLAAQWAKEEASAVIERLGWYRREAADAGHGWPDNCPLLAEELAARVSSPQAWLDSLSNAGLGRELGGPFLAALLRNHVVGWEEELARALRSDDLAADAVKLALILADLPDDLRRAAIQRGEEFPQLVETLALRSEYLTPLLKNLLAHGGPRASLAAAVGHWLADPRGTIDTGVASAWHEVILRTRGQEVDAGGPNDSLAYWLGEILKADPELALEWLFVEIETSPQYRFVSLHPTDIVFAAVQALSAEQRSRFVAAAPLNAHCGALVRLLVGDSLAVYRSLLGRDELRSLHLAPLGRCPDSGWWELAILALQAGNPPANVARAAFAIHGTEAYWGEESEHVSAWVEAFTSMTDSADPRLVEVAGLGEREARARVVEALRRERAEAMRGSE